MVDFFSCFLCLDAEVSLFTELNPGQQCCSPSNGLILCFLFYILQPLHPFLDHFLLMTLRGLITVYLQTIPILTWAPMKNSILHHLCDFLLPLSTTARILGGLLWWSSLVFPGLPCSFLATPFIGSAVSLRPPRHTHSLSRRSFRVSWRQPALKQQMQTTIQLVLNHEFSYLHIHLFKDNIHTSRVIIKSLYCCFAGTEWLE